MKLFLHSWKYYCNVLSSILLAQLVLCQLCYTLLSTSTQILLNDISLTYKYLSSLEILTAKYFSKVQIEINKRIIEAGTRARVPAYFIVILF